MASARKTATCPDSSCLPAAASVPMAERRFGAADFCRRLIWDSHGTGSEDDLMTGLPKRCQECDKPAAALVKDLKQRGLLDDTLVVWGGEFGRTPMNEERNGSKFLGRDHHPHAFTIWMSGGGIRGGLTYGETDELGYNIAKDPVHIHDLQATILHCLGI